jgi:hypothetical protein
LLQRQGGCSGNALDLCPEHTFFQSGSPTVLKAGTVN